MSDSRRGFGLEIGFVDHLYTRFGVTSNYSPALISTFHKSPYHPLSLFQLAVSPPVVPWQRLLTGKILQLHALKSSLHRLPYRTDLVVPNIFLITPRHGLIRNPRFQKYLYCNATIRCCGKVFIEPLPRKWSGIFIYLALAA
jgi:hypothetical protein